MTKFFPANGCVFSTGGGGKGLYALEGLNDGGGAGGGLGGASGLNGASGLGGGGGGSKAAIIIDSAPLQDGDITQRVAGLGNTRLLYVFGTTMGDVSVHGRLLLGPAGKSSEGIKQIKDYFDETRVFKSRKTVNLSVPGHAYKIFLLGFALGQPDPEFNIQPFVFAGAIADPLA